MKFSLTRPFKIKYHPPFSNTHLLLNKPPIYSSVINFNLFKIIYYLILLQLPYTISTDYETQQNALLRPELNIPTKGFVPNRVETFSVHLPCSGNSSEEVPVSIHLYVQAPSRRNDTKLNFLRNKICLKGKLLKKKTHIADKLTSIYIIQQVFIQLEIVHQNQQKPHLKDQLYWVLQHVHLAWFWLLVSSLVQCMFVLENKYDKTHYSK